MMIMDTNMLSKVQLVYIEGYHEDFSTSSVCRWEGVARQQSQAWGGWKWKREQKTVGVWGESKRGEKWKGGGGVKRLKDNNRNPGLEEENEGWRENENWFTVESPKIPPSCLWFKSRYLQKPVKVLSLTKIMKASLFNYWEVMSISSITPCYYCWCWGYFPK